jgi:sucrose phosphorylase
LLENLAALYGPQTALSVGARLSARLDEFRRRNPMLLHTTLPPPGLSERDVFLITYGDQFRDADCPPLRSLDGFLSENTACLITGLHVLPFYPSSSDEGFSVTDYRRVSPDLGTWADIRRLARRYTVMADLVLNHVSRESAWFRSFQRQERPYDDYFIVVPPGTDLSAVVRARTHPLVTPVETARGTLLVWTTFGPDQVDLNYRNPLVLLDMIQVMLHYVHQGIRVLRLDAIAYLWKEIGTPCIHLPQTHRVVKLLRAVLDAVAPGVLLVTETNVPHAENVSYFGDGTDEAHMVYQFSLPPLVLDAFHRADARVLSDWAASLTLPSSQTCFFNFLASHDGIGVRPVEGLLSADQVQALAVLVEQHGGLVSYRATPAGSSPYELNTTYFDALNGPGTVRDLPTQIDRFIASQAILLALAGVPGIYVHSLLGSRNWHQGVKETAQPRAINRQRFMRSQIQSELDDGGSLPGRVFQRYKALLAARAAEPAFHPQAGQEVLDLGPAVFALLRWQRDGPGRLLCLHNVTGSAQHLQLNAIGGAWALDRPVTDLILHQRISVERGLTLSPYGVAWLKMV